MNHIPRWQIRLTTSGLSATEHRQRQGRSSGRVGMPTKILRVFFLLSPPLSLCRWCWIDLSRRSSSWRDLYNNNNTTNEGSDSPANLISSLYPCPHLQRWWLTTNDDIFAINTFMIYRTADGIWNCLQCLHRLSVCLSACRCIRIPCHGGCLSLPAHALITFN